MSPPCTGSVYRRQSDSRWVAKVVFENAAGRPQSVMTYHASKRAADADLKRLLKACGSIRLLAERPIAWF
jgi:hypothetical protein